MGRRRFSALAAATVVLAALAIAACGSGSSGTSPCGAGGTADQAAFTSHFSAMDLVDVATGQPVPQDADNGSAFTAAQQVGVSATATAAVTVRYCVQQRSGSATTVSDTTASMSAGTGTTTLGTLPAGSMVVRVIVDGVLVRSLPLIVR